MVVVAAPIAATSDGFVIRLAFIAGTLLPLVSTALLIRRRSDDLKKTLGRMGAPKWAGDERAKRHGAVAPDVHYRSSGREPEEKSGAKR
jgi:hypothetical protein